MIQEGLDRLYRLDQRLTEGDSVMCVRNDGLGLPANLDQRRTKSLGLKLADGLAQQLGGELKIQRATTGGAAFRIEFSVPR